MNDVIPAGEWARRLAARLGDVPTMRLEEAVDTHSQADLLHSYLKRRGEKIPERHLAATLVVDLERRIGQLIATTSERPPGLTPALVKMARRFAEVTDAEWETLKLATLDGGGFREVTSTALMKLINRLDKVAHIAQLQVRSAQLRLAGTRVSTVVADPPWEYENAGTRNAVAWQYPTMTVEELHGLRERLDEVLEPNAHLYLWTTNIMMREAQTVMDAWGFAQKTILTWVKSTFGMGNYFRGTTEHVLFGVRGSLPTLTDTTRTHFMGDAVGHSVKPVELLELVERNSPGPWLEMFVRGDVRPGWLGWGKEVVR